MRQTILIISLLVIFTIIPANSVMAASNIQIKGHDIEVIIHPEAQSLTASDTVTLTGPSYGKFKFTLNKNLAIERITSEKKVVKYTTEPFAGEELGETGDTSNFCYVIADIPKGATSFNIRYSGVIYDEIEPSKALGRVRGDFTSGIISPEGVYLSSGSGWYPDSEMAIATFKIVSNVPKDWHVVTQGDLLDDKLEAGRRVSLWDSAVAYDGCVLVANNYFVRTRNIDGIDCSTYFYEDNPELSDTFLDKLAEYLPIYQRLFGKLPFSRFDVAENFFSTGYGMPAFTLLGSLVIKMPYATLEGSLAHELVHCWWGNYVYPDWNHGNWCEGLTYYSTNYLWNVLSKTPADAKEYRYTDMLKYTLQVSEKDAYSVRDFRYKETAVDGNIGYNKSAAIFGQVHELLGDEKFFQALRLVIARHGGTLTTWDDFKVIFEEVGGVDLEAFFKSWLDRADNPKLSFESVEQTKQDDSYLVKVVIVQEGEPFTMLLPVCVYSKGVKEAEMRVFSGDKKTEVSFKITDKADEIAIDPDFYIFRRLERKEIIPGLDATMTGKSLLIVLPDGGDADMLQIMDYSNGAPAMKDISVKQLYSDLVDSIIESGVTATIKHAADVTSDDLANNSVLCFGGATDNPVAKNIANALSGKFSADVGCFSLNGKDYTAEGDAILVSFRNPFNADYDVTLYMGNSPSAVFKASYIFYYTLWSYVIYDNGTAIDRGKWDRENGSLYRVL